MDPDVLIPVLLVATSLIVLIFRTNVSLSIMGLTAGYVLSDIVAGSVVSFIYSNNLDESSLPLASFVSIGLILLPALLMVFRFKGYQKGRIMQHILPAAAFALLAVLFILLNLPLDLTRELAAESVVFNRFIDNQVLIVVAVLAIAVFDVLAHEKQLRRKYKRRSKRKHRDKD